MNKKLFLFAAKTLAIVAILLYAAPVLTTTPVLGAKAYAQSADELKARFEGAKIKIIVGFTPGGGYDVSARLAAKHLSKYLPGNPKHIIVKNIPGGGGERSLRALWGEKPDGLTIATLTPTHIVNELLGTGSKYWDTSKQYIGSLRRQESALAFWVRSDIAKSWKEVTALQKALVEPATVPGDRLAAGAQLAQIMGFPVQVVYGYGGGSERRAAFERGEATCYTGGLISVMENFPDWAETKKAVPIFTWGPIPILDAPQEAVDWLKKLGVTENPPHIFDVLNPKESIRDAFLASTEIANIGRSGYALPPGASKEVVQMWKKALQALSKDEEYMKDMEVAGWSKNDFGYTTVEELMKLFTSVKKLDADAYNIFKKLSGVK